MPRAWDVAMGQRIRQRRETLGLTAAALSKRMRYRGHTAISPGHQLERETGKVGVQPWEIPDYCRVLQVPPWWLLGMTREESVALEAVFRNESEGGGRS